jgi:hypothetical protein
MTAPFAASRRRVAGAAPCPPPARCRAVAHARRCEGNPQYVIEFPAVGQPQARIDRRHDADDDCADKEGEHQAADGAERGLWAVSQPSRCQEARWPVRRPRDEARPLHCQPGPAHEKPRHDQQFGQEHDREQGRVRPRGVRLVARRAARLLVPGEQERGRGEYHLPSASRCRPPTATTPKASTCARGGTRSPPAGGSGASRGQADVPPRPPSPCSCALHGDGPATSVAVDYLGRDDQCRDRQPGWRHHHPGTRPARHAFIYLWAAEQIVTTGA